MSDKQSLSLGVKQSANIHSCQASNWTEVIIKFRPILPLCLWRPQLCLESPFFIICFLQSCPGISSETWAAGNFPIFHYVLSSKFNDLPTQLIGKYFFLVTFNLHLLTIRKRKKKASSNMSKTLLTLYRDSLLGMAVPQCLYLRERSPREKADALP